MDRQLTDIHYKPTDSHCYLECTSFLPVSYKDGIPFSRCPLYSVLMDFRLERKLVPDAQQSEWKKFPLRSFLNPSTLTLKI